MIVFSESSPQLPDSASLRDIERATEAARIAEWRVYYIPQDLPDGVNANDALWHVPPYSELALGVWIGYIPLPQHYTEIYEAALSRNIRLVNTPDQFQRAEEFDRFYPLIADLTAESECVSSVGECEIAAQRLGYPVFVKGTVQSFKSKGLGSCVARKSEELMRIATAVLSSTRRSLGKIIVRRLLELRHTRMGPGGFPLGREYRVFVYESKVVGLGYYWEGEDDLAALSTKEQGCVAEIAIEVSRRLAVPYLSVDVGQTREGNWIVIEVGDGQFSGISQTPIHQLWAQLSDAVRNEASGIPPRLATCWAS